MKLKTFFLVSQVPTFRHTNQTSKNVGDTTSKDTLKAFDNFENKQKCVWSNMFWYVKVCVLWKCIQYTMHWDKTQMLKKFYGFIFNCNFVLFLLNFMFFKLQQEVENPMISASVGAPRKLTWRQIF